MSDDADLFGGPWFDDEPMQPSDPDWRFDERTGLAFGRCTPIPIVVDPMTPPGYVDVRVGDEPVSQRFRIRFMGSLIEEAT